MQSKIISETTSSLKVLCIVNGKKVIEPHLMAGLF